MKALFLDRDGVLNIENPGGYITVVADFQFYEGVQRAVAQLQPHFDAIFLVTNQRCVGKGMITTENLDAMHSYMNEQLSGAIRKIYYAPSLETEHPDRKPNTGMALQAKRDYPNIDFEQSTMVGNNLSDMEFGKRMGMHTVLLSTTQPAFTLPHHLIDEQFDSLLAFSNTFTITNER